MEYILDLFQLFWYEDGNSTKNVNHDYIAIRQIDNEDLIEDPDPDSIPFFFDLSRVYGTMYQRVYQS